MVRPVDGSATWPLIRTVDVPGRGSVLFWECAGPPGAPCLVLLHGVSMTAELGWSLVIRRLARSYRVIAPDLRGHGGGIACGARFGLDDCADDVAALAHVLELDRVIVVGYSMGGIVAQLLWRRHRALVAGLVLCATARNVRGSPLERIALMALPAIGLALRWNPAARFLTAEMIAVSVLGSVEGAETRGWVRGQLRRTSFGAALSAVQAVSEFSSRDWIGAVDVPTAVVVTTRDTLLPASRQRRLAAAIPRAKVVELPAGHGACVEAPAQFAAALTTACALVASPPAERSAAAAAASSGAGEPRRRQI